MCVAEPQGVQDEQAHSPEQAELITECNFSRWLGAKMDILSDKILYSSISFSLPATFRHLPGFVNVTAQTFW